MVPFFGYHVFMTEIFWRQNFFRWKKISNNFNNFVAPSQLGTEIFPNEIWRFYCACGPRKIFRSEEIFPAGKCSVTEYHVFVEMLADWRECKESAKRQKSVLWEQRKSTFTLCVVRKRRNSKRALNIPVLLRQKEITNKNAENTISVTKRWRNPFRSKVKRRKR